ncbi:MAG: argininosuccinate lyase [Cyclobacteriaceae bacterium]|nr:argininosuccinate lyase [Cyclobacteriaceae bacterium]
MKLWQKSSDVNKTIERFTVGKDKILDMELAYFDVVGSMAHAKMLAKIGILTHEEQIRIQTSLAEILGQIESGKYYIKEGVEDIHSQVELTLTEALGETGKKIHTGRSRNDQVLLDLKLYMRHQIFEIVGHVENLFRRFITLSNQFRHVILPGYTHFQAAMPSSFGLWFGAYAESLADDLVMLKSALEIINRNPLGSAAGYGSSFPLDRQMTTELLAFDSMDYNVVYAQMGRGKAEKVLAAAMGSIADTLGKFSYDVCLYMSQNFGFIRFPDEYTTGSSIMPHKKNPDVFEIIRGKSNRIKSLVNEFNLLTGNLPSGYHREMQLLKESLFDGIHGLKECLYMASFMLEKVQINENIMDDERYNYIYSVELVNDLVRRGTSFREAYREVGKKINEGEYKPRKQLDHTHDGSLGNLMNDRIEALMQAHLDFFKIKNTRIEKSIRTLIEDI